VHHWLAFVVIAWFTSCPAWAVRIVLLENYHGGRLMQLEPGGRFSHVAIEFKGQWLHAHPARERPEVTDAIEHFGRNPVHLANPEFPEPTDAQVATYLNKNYGYELEWRDGDDTTYSARLVGELLGIRPRPAYFLAEIWGRFVGQGGLGLSPDDIFEITTRELGFVLVDPCDNLLLN
jgi:hypothetical protein